ncbi:MAG: hypothetical protein HS130_07815 [Deltaproteobacteria bacterium]|nr:hypothetical protein [Deltaproteobacteria bacterium]MCL4873082.1 hypothetical protein [bacterium]
MSGDDKKQKIIDLFKEAQKRGKPLGKSKTPLISQIIEGNGNIQAGRDVNINRRVIKRVLLKPSPELLTPAQKQTIKEKISELVNIGAIAGKDKADLFPLWWSRLQKKFRVNSYLELHQAQYPLVLKWLSQQKAINRPKLRRRDNEAWRKELYLGIWGKTKELKQPKEWVYFIVQERIGKTVSSLTELGERDIQKLYRILMSMGR